MRRWRQSSGRRSGPWRGCVGRVAGRSTGRPQTPGGPTRCSCSVRRAAVATAATGRLGCRAGGSAPPAPARWRTAARVGRCRRARRTHRCRSAWRGSALRRGTRRMWPRCRWCPPACPPPRPAVPAPGAAMWRRWTALRAAWGTRPPPCRRMWCWRRHVRPPRRP